MKTVNRICITLLFIGLIENCFSQEVWSLKRCQEVGIKNNLKIDRQVLSNRYSYINVKQQKAAVLPAINAAGNQNFGFGRSIDPTTNQFIQQGINSNNFSINGNMKLFNGFQNKQLIEQAKLQYESGKLGVLEAENELKISIANQYLQIALYEKQTVIANIQVQSLTELVKNQQSLYKSGVQSESGLAAAKGKLSDAIYKQTQIESQLLLSKLEMCQLLQIPYDKDFAIEAIDMISIQKDSNQVLNSDNIYRYSKDRAPQIQRALMSIKSSIASVKAAQRGALPMLSMNFGVQTLYSSQNYEVSGYSYALSSLPSGFVNRDLSQAVYGIVAVPVTAKTSFENQIKNNFSQYVNFQLMIPVWNHRQNWALVERAKVNLEIAKNHLEQVSNDLRKNIEIAIANEKNARAKFKAAQDMYESNILSYELSKKRILAGVMSIYDFVSIQSNYQQSEHEFTQSQYELYFRSLIVNYYLREVN